eukprot:sb/3470710/
MSWQFYHHLSNEPSTSSPTNSFLLPTNSLFPSPERSQPQYGHLVFSPEVEDDNVHDVATPEPTRNERVATTDEFHRELSRLDLSNIHGKILNEVSRYLDGIRSYFNPTPPPSQPALPSSDVIPHHRSVENLSRDRSASMTSRDLTMTSSSREMWRARSLSYLGSMADMGTPLRSGSLLTRSEHGNRSIEFEFAGREERL